MKATYSTVLYRVLIQIYRTDSRITEIYYSDFGLATVNMASLRLQFIRSLSKGSAEVAREAVGGRAPDGEDRRLSCRPDFGILGHVHSTDFHAQRWSAGGRT